jgi:hypothetical protein
VDVATQERYPADSGMTLAFGPVLVYCRLTVSPTELHRVKLNTASSLSAGVTVTVARAASLGRRQRCQAMPAPGLWPSP